MQKLTSWVVVLGMLGVLVGCGDDDDGQAAVGATPALTPAQCPAAPGEVTLDSIAPVWGGLLVVNATVASRTADDFDLEILDPTLGAWTRSYGGFWQREDGRYALPIRPSVTEQNKDEEFKLRVRSRLDGCAPSAWSEGPTFTLTDPLSDTSWKASWDPGSISGEMNLNLLDIAMQTSVSTTLEFDGPLTHLSLIHI